MDMKQANTKILSERDGMGVNLVTFPHAAIFARAVTNRGEEGRSSFSIVSTIEDTL